MRAPADAVPDGYICLFNKTFVRPFNYFHSLRDLCSRGIRKCSVMEEKKRRKRLSGGIQQHMRKSPWPYTLKMAWMCLALWGKRERYSGIAPYLSINSNKFHKNKTLGLNYDWMVVLSSQFFEMFSWNFVDTMGRLEAIRSQQMRYVTFKLLFHAAVEAESNCGNHARTISYIDCVRAEQ